MDSMSNMIDHVGMNVFICLLTFLYIMTLISIYIRVYGNWCMMKIKVENVQLIFYSLFGIRF